MRFAPGPRPRDMRVTDRVEVYTRHAGNIAVAEGGMLELYGQLDGNVTIERGGRAKLYGMIAGNLTLERGGHVELYGLINGDLYDGGGNIEMRGHVSGEIYHSVDDAAPTNTTTAPADPTSTDRSDGDAERIAILQMIAQGHLSADEGDLLLRALG